jgi:hypothetical protein
MVKTGVLVLIVAIVLGCGSVTQDSASFRALPPSEEMIRSESQAAFIPGSESQLDSGQTANLPRKRIMSGNIRLKHAEPDSLAKQVVQKLEELKGYVASSQNDRNWHELNLRVPASEFSSFITFLETIGQLESKSLSTTDITKDYYDLKTRIENHQALVTRIRRYLTEAKTIKEILEVEQTLTKVTSELESMLATQQGWDRDVEFSQLNVVIVPLREEVAIDWPDVKQTIDELGRNIVWFFYGFVVFLVYLVIFGVPILLVVLLIIWLILRNQGLIKKLVSKRTSNQ